MGTLLNEILKVRNRERKKSFLERKRVFVQMVFGIFKQPDGAVNEQQKYPLYKYNTTEHSNIQNIKIFC